MSKLKKPQEVTIAGRLVSTFNSADRRGKDFNLTLQYIANIIAQDRCAYSGEKFDNSDENEKMTLERFDNNLGYVEGNVIPVKKKYNNARADYEKDELIKRLDELSARIVRASDKGEVVVPEPQVENGIDNILPKYRSQYASILQNIHRREEHIKRGKSGLSPELLVSLKARIAGGRSELKRIEKLSLGKAVSSGAAKRASKAEHQVQMYDIIITGLTRFENLSKLDKAKLRKGLPLSASLFQLLRGKM